MHSGFTLADRECFLKKKVGIQSQKQPCIQKQLHGYGVCYFSISGVIQYDPGGPV